MHNSCDIVYELPTSKHDQKKNICNVVMCILVFLIFWNTMSQPHVIYREKIPQMVSSIGKKKKSVFVDSFIRLWISSRSDEFDFTLCKNET